MINGISGAMGMMPMMGINSNQPSLSDEQQTLISDTLSSYDPDNLTADDATAIIEIFQDAGIQPGQALTGSMSELGFDARQLGELAGLESPGEMGGMGMQGGMAPPPPPPESAGVNQEMQSYLEELVSEYGDSALSEEDKVSILSAMQERFGLSDGGSLINTTA